MTGAVNVCLNALINPANAGGSESSALSIVTNFAQSSPPDIEMYVTALPPYLQQMVAIRGRADRVIEWPWREFTTVSSEPTARWAKDVRRRLHGPLATIFDNLSRAANERAFLRGMPSRNDIDQILDKKNIDVVHFTYPVKWPTRRPYIFEPHDVQQKHFPDFFPPDVLHWRHKTYTDGIRNSAFVVCGTWWTKQDIMRHFGVPASQIAVIPRSSTMARATLAKDEIEAIAAAMKLPETFAYYPAMTFPHKNHIRLLEAIALLRDRHRIRLVLVCTGRPYKPFHPQIDAAVKRLGLEDQFRFLGKVSDEQLSVCYQKSTFIVFPSLLEGHSQSLLESLYHRKPIVAAKQSSVPETVGKAGLLFDALDVEGIVDALRRACSDPDLLGQLRSEISDSFDRYDWGRAMRTLTACYKSAAGRTLTAEERVALDRALSAHPPD